MCTTVYWHATLLISLGWHETCSQYLTQSLKWVIHVLHPFIKLLFSIYHQINWPGRRILSSYYTICHDHYFFYCVIIANKKLPITCVLSSVENKDYHYIIFLYRYNNQTAYNSLLGLYISFVYDIRFLCVEPPVKSSLSSWFWFLYYIHYTLQDTDALDWSISSS